MISKLKTKKYGVTEQKKSELDALSLQVLDAQQQVDQFQSIVTALTTKQTTFLGFLATAETNRKNALNNQNAIDAVVQNYLDLQKNSGIAFNALVTADQKTQKLAGYINDVVNKLIYASEVINKLATYVVRKKALNPLVSDELVSTLGTAGTDANNAVALTLVALQSVYAAQASNMESEAAFSLEYAQSIAAYNFLVVSPADAPSATTQLSLQQLLHNAYTNAKNYYDEIYDASVQVTSELNNAQLSLNAAQIQLQSLQSGLAAGTAAAFAS